MELHALKGTIPTTKRICSLIQFPYPAQNNAEKVPAEIYPPAASFSENPSLAKHSECQAISSCRMDSITLFPLLSIRIKCSFLIHAIRNTLRERCDNGLPTNQPQLGARC